MNFNCSQCGLCCRLVGTVIESAKKSTERSPIVWEALNFPYQYNEFGTCEMLGDDNQCKVYNSRPLICNVAKMYEKYYSHDLSREEYYTVNGLMCNTLQEVFKEKKL